MNRILRKILMNGIVIVPLLMWFTEATFWSSVITALILSVVSYIVGDQMILRASNNTVATIADVGLTFVYYWLVADMLDWSLTIGELTTLSIAVGVVEFIYHRQLGEADGNGKEMAK